MRSSIPRWRYFRNLTILLVLVVSSLLALARVCALPIHWLWAIPLFYLTYLVWNAYSFTHPRRLRYWPLRDSLFANTGSENVWLKTQDGVNLFARYVPGNNRAAIILAHGLGGSGLLMQGHAEFLRDAGYSILLLDLRAHGRSEGNTSTYGVLEAQDVLTAVDYLLARDDVDADKIGVFGVSLGAQAALRGAWQSQAIRALVLEGLGPADIQDRIRPMPVQEGDTLRRLRRKIGYPLALFDQWLFNFFSGQHPTPLTAELGKMAPRPLLFIACGPREIELNRWFCAAAPETCILWELPRARHAAALIHEPEEYPRRMIAFFDDFFT